MVTDLQAQADIFRVATSFNDIYSAFKDLASGRSLTDLDKHKLQAGADWISAIDWDAECHNRSRGSLEKVIQACNLRPDYYRFFGEACVHFGYKGSNEKFTDKLHRVLASGGDDFDLFYDEASVALHIFDGIARTYSGVLDTGNI